MYIFPEKIKLPDLCISLQIPRNTLLLYLHSYQSLIWNKIVSRRIKQFGLRPIAGDLIWVKKSIDEDSVPLDEETDKDEVIEDRDEDSDVGDPSSAEEKESKTEF